MTMEASLEQNEYAQPRFGLEVFSAFAAIGLVLVTIGVYSVISYTVTQQKREMASVLRSVRREAAFFGW
jgi:hypothetical protein